jgi:thymidine kinase
MHDQASTTEGPAVNRHAPAARRGVLTVIEGCMFAGKTTTLIRMLDNYPPDAVVAFKQAVDRRYRADAIVSHGGKALPAIIIETAAELTRYVRPGTRAVAIDEGHFFDDALVDVVLDLAAEGLDVYVTSLDRDSWGRPFPLADRLRAVADRPLLLTAECASCHAVADRTQRLTPIVNGNLVGGPESYAPRCEKCWSPPPEPPP